MEIRSIFLNFFSIISIYLFWYGVGYSNWIFYGWSWKFEFKEKNQLFNRRFQYGFSYYFFEKLLAFSCYGFYLFTLFIEFS